MVTAEIVARGSGLSGKSEFEVRLWWQMHRARPKGSTVAAVTRFTKALRLWKPGVTFLSNPALMKGVERVGWTVEPGCWHKRRLRYADLQLRKATKRHETYGKATNRGEYFLSQMCPPQNNPGSGKLTIIILYDKCRLQKLLSMPDLESTFPCL